jgi:hypothetical protein
VDGPISCYDCHKTQWHSSSDILDESHGALIQINSGHWGPQGAPSVHKENSLDTKKKQYREGNFNFINNQS